MFQMTRQRLAEVEIRGKIHTYKVTDDQLETAARKMRDGVGSLEWVPRNGDEPDIINIRSIDRIRPDWSAWDRSTALVQLAYRISTGECFVVDPDQSPAVFLVGDPGAPDQEFPARRCRTFGEEAAALVAGEFMDLADWPSIPRPPADGDIVLIAEWTHPNGARLVDRVDAGVGGLSETARLYLGDLAPIPQRRGPVDDDPGAGRAGCDGDPCTLDHMHFFPAHTEPEGATA